MYPSLSWGVRDGGVFCCRAANMNPASFPGFCSLFSRVRHIIPELLAVMLFHLEFNIGIVVLISLR